MYHMSRFYAKSLETDWYQSESGDLYLHELNKRKVLLKYAKLNIEYGMTAGERSKKYRDPVRHAEYLRKERERYQKRKEKRRKIYTPERTKRDKN